MRRGPIGCSERKLEYYLKIDHEIRVSFAQTITETNFLKRQKAAQLTQSTHMYANPTVERELAVWRHGRFSYLLCSGYHSVLSPCIVCSTDLMATNSAPGSIGVPFQGLSTQGSIDAFFASTKVGSASLER